MCTFITCTLKSVVNTNQIDLKELKRINKKDMRIEPEKKNKKQATLDREKCREEIIKRMIRDLTCDKKDVGVSILFINRCSSSDPLVTCYSLCNGENRHDHIYFEEALKQICKEHSDKMSEGFKFCSPLVDDKIKIKGEIELTPYIQKLTVKAYLWTSYEKKESGVTLWPIN